MTDRRPRDHFARWPKDAHYPWCGRTRADRGMVRCAARGVRIAHTRIARSVRGIRRRKRRIDISCLPAWKDEMHAMRHYGTAVGFLLHRDERSPQRSVRQRIKLRSSASCDTSCSRQSAGTDEQFGVCDPGCKRVWFRDGKFAIFICVDLGSYEPVTPPFPISVLIARPKWKAGMAGVTLI
jgi:hypothetical protein